MLKLCLTEPLDLGYYALLLHSFAYCLINYLWHDYIKCTKTADSVCFPQVEISKYIALTILKYFAPWIN